MGELHFRFKVLPYQTEAAESTVDVFAGQPYQAPLSYRRDVLLPGEGAVLGETEEEFRTGFGNAPVALSSAHLLENLQRVQKRNAIAVSSSLSQDKELGACLLDVEMETGTGKTYVYIKTMFEMNRQYGWSKFIIVVPSIAIREGVAKSFKTMESHFMEQYGKKARAFVYDSRDLARIDEFTHSADLEVMIINVQAFNARGKDARRIRMELDEFGSRAPIKVISRLHPIVILDEPQKMGGKATQQSLRDFSPLFCLHYSATHREHHSTVYVLDALDAYEKRLVKRIEVKGIRMVNLTGKDAYVFLESIVLSTNAAPRVRLVLEVDHAASGIRRERHIFSAGDDLFHASKGITAYKEGYTITEIDPAAETVTFMNGLVLHTGEAAGNMSEAELRRTQIRETIRSHFKKEQELFARGIKTLSLFFIDKVERYRKYDEAGDEVRSEYAKMFEEEYENIRLEEAKALFTPAYEEYLSRISAHETHAGYFSIDKKGRATDGVKGKDKDSDDISAYDLILKDKERLLSFENPVRFIFSHSALREGWDNPNVFQICTLKEGGDSAAAKRQEIGRGLRLAVDRYGNRQDEAALGEHVQDVNQLTVVTTENYGTFVAALQKEIGADLYERPSKASVAYFAGKTFEAGGKTVTLTEMQANKIIFYLGMNGYADMDGQILDKYREDAKAGTLRPLPEDLAPYAEEIHRLISGIFDPSRLDGMFRDGNRTQPPENRLNENFQKKEFRALWNYINHKYVYTVSFDSEELIAAAVRHIDDELNVPPLYFVIERGMVKISKNAPGKTAVGEHISDYVPTAGESRVRYDLIGKVAAGAHLTRRTAAEILSRIRPDKFAQFRKNPEEFIRRTARLINETKGTLLVEHITYDKTDGTYDQSIFTAEKRESTENAFRGKKCILDLIYPDGYAKDGESVERRFAESLDASESVAVYAKLPKGFAIPTPVGNYSPDWAIAFYEGTVKHIYFIAETKGSMSSLMLDKVEESKIRCAERLFEQISGGNVFYRKVDSYEELMGLMK